MNFDKIKTELLKNYAPNSVKSYFFSFRKVIKGVYDKNLSNITLEDIKDTDKVKKYLESIENLSIRKVLLNGYIKVIYHMNIPLKDRNELDQYLKELQREEQKSREYAKPTEKEKAMKFEYSKISDELKKIESKYKFKKWQNITNSIKLIMLTILKNIPPLRNEDYATTQIVYKDSPKIKDKNRLIIREKKWILKDFKTKKSINERVFDVPTDVIDAIKKVKAIYPDYTYIFPKITNIKKPAITQSVTNFLKRMLGGGVQILRKIYISDMIDKGANADDRKKTANIMGHSAKQAMFNYSKFSDILHENNKELNESLYRFKQKYGKKKLLEILKEADEEMKNEKD